MKRLVLVGLVSASSVAASAQQGFPLDPSFGVFSKVAVAGVPFSAKATTTITERRESGPRVRRLHASYHRDAVGRVRVDYDIPATSGSGGHASTIGLLIPDPSERRLYSFDSRTGTFRHSRFDLVAYLFNPLRGFVMPLDRTRFDSFSGAQRILEYAAPERVGRRDLDGVSAIAYRVSDPGGSGMIAEWWEANELRVILYVRQSSPQGPDIEFRLSPITLTEPAPELFRLPDVVDELESDLRFDFCVSDWDRQARARSSVDCRE